MKDHTPNCEIRILGTRNCTCGAVEDGYDGSRTSNAVTDATTPIASQRAAPAPEAQATPAVEISAVFRNADVLEVVAPTTPKVVVVNGRVFTILSKA